jgi:hypothetical protein
VAIGPLSQALLPAFLVDVTQARTAELVSCSD